MYVKRAVIGWEQGSVGDYCERGNNTSAFTKVEEFLYWLIVTTFSVRSVFHRSRSVSLSWGEEKNNCLCIFVRYTELLIIIIIITSTGSTKRRHRAEIFAVCHNRLYSQEKTPILMKPYFNISFQTLGLYDRASQRLLMNETNKCTVNFQFLLMAQ